MFLFNGINISFLESLDVFGYLFALRNFMTLQTNILRKINNIFEGKKLYNSGNTRQYTCS